MRTTSYSDLRRNLAGALDSVADCNTPLSIFRDRARAAALLMSLEDYASLKETSYTAAIPKDLGIASSCVRRVLAAAA